MKKIVAKFIISIAIGIIVGEYFGNKNEIVKYYMAYNGKKSEISKEQFDSKDYKKIRLQETYFNYRSFLTYSLTVSSAFLLVFFVGDLRKKDE